MSSADKTPEKLRAISTGPRSSQIPLKKIEAAGAGFVLAFWAVFYASYPYRMLVDDTTYRGVLRNNFFFYHIEQKFSRLLHDGLLYSQGFFFEPSMEKAVFMSILIHLLTGWITWRKLIPLLPPTAQPLAILGLIAAMVHPAALQTVVHVSQQGEILGGLFISLSLVVFLKSLREGATPRRYAALVACGFLALSSKESFGVLPFVLSAALFLRHRSRAGGAAVAALAAFLTLGAYFNSYSRDTIQNEENYRRSEAFHEAFVHDRMISDKDSLILPLRTREENIRLQASLTPLFLQILYAPFGLVKDYGHFPFGKKTYEWDLPWLWIGAGILLLLALLSWKGRRLHPPEHWLLIFSPFIHYGVYWVFVVFDPFMLYRLHGSAYLALVLTMPLVLAPFSKRSIGGRPTGLVLASQIAGLVVSAGLVRGYEMKDPIRETALELRRQPFNYRNYNSHMQELIKADRVVDCEGLLKPALTLAPSASLVYLEWAWCLAEQGRKEEAKVYALKSLEQEAVPQNISLALDYLVGTEGAQLDTSRIHPFNMKYLPFKEGPIPGPAHDP